MLEKVVAETLAKVASQADEDVGPVWAEELRLDDGFDETLDGAFGFPVDDLEWSRRGRGLEDGGQGHDKLGVDARREE